MCVLVRACVCVCVCARETPSPPRALTRTCVCVRVRVIYFHTYALSTEWWTFRRAPEERGTISASGSEEDEEFLSIFLVVSVAEGGERIP